MRTEPKIFGNFVKLLKTTAPSSATLASYSFLSPLRFAVAHAFTRTRVFRRHVRMHAYAIHFALLFSLSSALSLSLSVRLFLHFPGPLAPEEDISFHSVITGEPNLHNTRVARGYRHLHFILIAVIDWISPRIPSARRNEAGADQPSSQSSNRRPRRRGVVRAL